MILAKKVRLYPNEWQQQKLWQSVGTARFVYNWTLAKQEDNYKNGGKFIADGVLRKELTQLKKKNCIGYMKYLIMWLNKQLKMPVMLIKDFSMDCQINLSLRVKEKVKDPSIMTM